MKFQLVLPCYNEAKSLQVLIDRARRAAQEAGYSSQEFGLVLVENGSKDNSREVLAQLAADPERAPWFRMVPVDINQGYGFGLWQGLSATTAEYVGWSHADQQCDPADAFRALEIIRKEPDARILVKGVRRGRDWKDRIVSRVFEILAWIILGSWIREVNAQPKVFSRELLSHLPQPPKTFAFDLYVLHQALRSGYRFRTISVLFPPRVHGVSNWAATFVGRYRTILGMIRYMLELRSSQRTR